MNDATLDNLCNIAAAAAILGAGAAGTTVAPGVFEAVTATGGLAIAARQSQRHDFKRTLEKAKREIRRDYRQWIEREHGGRSWYAEANLNAAIAEFGRVIDRCVPMPEDVVGANLSADKLVDLLLSRAAQHSAAYSSDSDNPMARAVFRSIVRGAYTLIRDDPNYAATLRTYVDERILTGLDTLNSSQERTESKIDELLAKFSAERGVPLNILQGILAKLGESDVALDPAVIEERLREVADRHVELTVRLRALSNDDPGVVRLRKKAADALESGNYDRADELLSEATALDERAIDAQQDALDRRRLSLAHTLADRGELERARLSYRKAAGHFAAAAARVPDTAREVRWHYLLSQAKALYDQGHEFGDNVTLHEAIAVYRLALSIRPRRDDPIAWAMTQNNLGNALSTLGQRESCTARLEEAAAAFRAALEKVTRDRVPLDWAMIQSNLGAALKTLGERESGTARLEEAVAALRAALEVRTRESVPLSWAANLNNLGNALQSLGQRESGTARLEEAVAAYRAALSEYTRERVPLDWAMTQNNLGNALTTLGERESGTASLEEAVAAYRAALGEYTRERVPLDWATTQSNLGAALKTLGERESGTARLKEAIAAFRAALKERTRERVPLDWAMTQNNLGNALQAFGERESGTARLEEAVAAYRAAVEEYTRERVPLAWALIQNNLGTVLRALGERESGTAPLKQAVAAFRSALEVLRDAGADFYVSGTRQNLERAEALLRERGGE